MCEFGFAVSMYFSFFSFRPLFIYFFLIHCFHCISFRVFNSLSLSCINSFGSIRLADFFLKCFLVSFFLAHYPLFPLSLSFQLIFPFLVLLLPPLFLLAVTYLVLLLLSSSDTHLHIGRYTITT